LGANKLTDATAAVLPTETFAATLRELQLGGNELGVEGVRALASGRFTNLVELDLAGCKFGDGGIRALTSGAEFPRLRYLRLRAVDMSDTGLAELVGWKGLSGVQSLNISRNRITPDSVSTLLASPHLAAVRRCQIDVSETPLEQDPRDRARLQGQFNHVVFDPGIRG
jgi:hypothetical protein